MKDKFPFKVSLFKPSSRGLTFISQGTTLLAILGISLLPLFAHAGFLDKALKFGKNLLATAAGNYTSKYQQDLTQLLQALRQPGTTNQPLLQGITPGNPNNPNAPGNQNPYGENVPYGSNPDYENQYGQNHGYSQENQDGGYDGQPQNAGYPQDPNYGAAPSNNPYSQDQGCGLPHPTGCSVCDNANGQREGFRSWLSVTCDQQGPTA